MDPRRRRRAPHHPTGRTALTPATAADRQGPHPDTPGAGLLRCAGKGRRLASDRATLRASTESNSAALRPVKRILVFPSGLPILTGGDLRATAGVRCAPGPKGLRKLFTDACG